MLWRAILVEQTKEEPDHCEGACQDEREQLAKVGIRLCVSARLSIPAPQKATDDDDELPAD